LSLLEGAAASLSSARLSAFRAAPDEPGDLVLGRYLWNVALAEALYPTFHFLEVQLRNAFHGGIAMIAGPRWYDLATVVANENARADIMEAKRRIVEAGHPVDPPRVVAALNIGFWAGLCNREYEQGPLSPVSQIPLWPVLFKHVGPLLPQSLRTRASLSEFLGRVRIIRNRAYHHEPIWNGVRDRHGARVPLSVDHGHMQQLIQSLSPQGSGLLGLCDRFSEVFDRGATPWVEDVRRYCAENGVAP
jgi:hypothetical protein